MPLVAVKSIDTFKDRSISELLADIGELEDQGVFVKKQPIKTKKKKKQAQDVVEKVEAVVDLEESSPAAYLEVDANIYSAHKKMPIAYNARVNDWFVDQERALTVQGYKQGEDFFKQGLLSKYGERVIVFNHRFPRIIDQIILRDVKIIPIVQDDGSYLVKIPGYYTDGNELRHFGFFEVAYSIKESSVISTKKKKNGSLTTNIEIFHRFFRPVDEFSDLFSNAGNESPHFLVENELEKYEIEAVEAVNSAWTVDEEQEGWKAQLENEENGFILINHSEKLLNYVLLI